MKIYNTITRSKEEFSPISGKKVKMYTCGQTVYNDIHMGNARFYVVFDAIRRYLLYKDYDVNFVQNFTDIDDKIIAKANEEGVDSQEIAERYIARTLEDLDALNCLRATINPRATQEVPEIIALIESLMEKNFAYENNGTVYYDVEKFADYGKLSRKKTDELEAGARVEVEAGKRNAADFVLWKPAKPDEPKWESPWGDGRPGWHIECSAMAKKYLGDQIDIHGGGDDLIFPHHENEIAQTEAVTGLEFARCWIHSGILTTDHKKMSKSRGNFFTLREMVEKGFSHDVIRFYFLSGHYRMPMELTDKVLNAAGNGLARIRTCYGNLLHAERNALAAENPPSAQHSPHWEDFHAAMDDDFNTADAITAIFELVKSVNTFLAGVVGHSKGFHAQYRREMEKMCEILGIRLAEAGADSPDDAEIESMIAARQEARKNRDFAASDKIRDDLAGMGIILEDTAGGVRWRRG